MKFRIFRTSDMGPDGPSHWYERDYDSITIDEIMQVAKDSGRWDSVIIGWSRKHMWKDGYRGPFIEVYDDWTE